MTKVSGVTKLLKTFKRHRTRVEDVRAHIQENLFRLLTNLANRTGRNTHDEHLRTFELNHTRVEWNVAVRPTSLEVLQEPTTLRGCTTMGVSMSSSHEHAAWIIPAYVLPSNL